MAKEQGIKINACRQGIAISPLVGFADCRNLDISTVPGAVRLNKVLAAVTGTIGAQIMWIIRHPVTTTEFYALSSAGVVYKSTDSGATFTAMTGNTQTSCHGNGLAIFANYLVVARDAYIDVCGDGTATGIGNGAWTNGWKAIDSDVLWHPMIISKLDGKLYGGADRYIFTLEELTTFVPATANTYTWTQQALDLPKNYRVKCLEELGNNLMIGTWQGTAVNSVRVADIFTWDGTSVTYGQPIVLNDYGVHAMLNDGGTLIVLAGISGQIRECNGSSAWPIGQIPFSMINPTGKYIEFFPGALCKYKSKYFFGVGYTAALGAMGVYSLEKTGRGNILNLEHTVSTGNSGVANKMQISALAPVSNEQLLVGYFDNTTAGIDLTSATAYPTDYSGYFISPLYEVGDILNLKTFAHVFFQLSNKLATGEGIRVSYRNNLSDDFTLFKNTKGGTLSLIYSVLAAIISALFNSDIPPCELLQIKCEILGVGGASGTTPHLKSLTII